MTQPSRHLSDQPLDDDVATPPVLTVEGRVATMRLNRPQHHNRIEPEDLAAIHAILDDIEARPAIRVLVVTGTGRSFSSGYHLGDLAGRAEPAGGAPRADESGFERMVDRVETLAVPTICRLNGGVYGGSTDLALACDFRIGTDGVKMFMPAVRLGLHYYAGGVQRYVARLGPDGAKRLFLTAETIGAAEMLRIGFLTEIVAPDALDTRVAELASALAANAPVVTQGLKRSINEIARGGHDRAVLAQRHRDSLAGAELQEGLAAFREKRKPDFRD